MVCKRKQTTPCHSLVKQIFTSTFTSREIEYGKVMEEVAIRKLEEKIGQPVNPSGLFIDNEHKFLVASPGGHYQIRS